MENKDEERLIPFYLVTGFLGSGKTTFLKDVLVRFSCNKRIAVIQNEFAAQGVDGTDLKLTGSGFRLVEINNGSVFCVCLMATFVESLQNVIKEYNPEMIFLEASGLADPINIIELLGGEGMRDKVGLAHIITIVDAPNFERGMKMLPRFRHQIMIADTVIVNKSDISNGSNSFVINEIRKLNPFAGIIETVYCKTDLKDLIFNEREILNFKTIDPENEGKYNNSTNIPDNKAFCKSPDSNEAKERQSAAGDSEDGFLNSGATNKAAALYANRKSGARPDINACVLRAHEKLTPEGLELFINELQESSPRIKGFINLKNGDVMAVQTVFEQCDFSLVSGYEGPSELIAFGRDLTPRHLRDLLRKHCYKPMPDSGIR